MRKMPMDSNQIEREIVINAPVSRVWAALTEAEHVGTWFGDDGAEVDLRPGGVLTISWKEHGAFHTTIERVEPERFFSWRWTYTAGQAPRADNSTLVEFSLTPEGAGTRLRVVESGFQHLDMPEAQRAKRFRENTQGWQEEIDELREYVERLAA
jgi:uncharacterized protein YndB with AHSA1/START domain